jgi:predicted lysophospholipase L1 biosynthesis ABC-type transport system permease subunit
MTIGNWIRLGLRESRGAGGRLLFFAACLAVGVAAVVAVAGLSRALDDGIQARAKTLLAADVAVESRRPIEPEILRVVDGLKGVRRARVVEMASVVAVPRSDKAAPGPSVLCEIKAVEPGYPFYGAVATTPDAPLEALLDRDHVLVGPEVLLRSTPGSARRFVSATKASVSPGPSPPNPTAWTSASPSDRGCSWRTRDWSAAGCWSRAAACPTPC